MTKFSNGTFNKKKKKGLPTKTFPTSNTRQPQTRQSDNLQPMPSNENSKYRRTIHNNLNSNPSAVDFEELRRIKEARKGKIGARVDAATDTESTPDPAPEARPKRLVAQYTATADMVHDIIAHDDDEANDPLKARQSAKSIYDRESEYQRQRFERPLDEPTDEASYEKVRELREVEREEKRVEELIQKKELSAPPARKRRWDVVEPEKPQETAPKPRRSRWDQVPEAPPQQSTQSHSVLSDEYLDSVLPSEGYEILEPPVNYVPLTTAANKLISAPATTDGFVMLEESNAQSLGMSQALPTEIPGVGELQFFKESDMAHFGKLTDRVNENELTVEELKERKIMRLLLKIKNGVPPVRKAALRQISDNARSFGADAIFKQLLPLLRERTLEDQERHLLVKVIDRVLHKLGDEVRPHTRPILVVIEPLLIDSDQFAQSEGRDVIATLSKAVGMAHMILTMRSDLDNENEYVRNTTARAFAVVASTLGIPALLPFVRAVCLSKKSWEARHTGIKIVQRIAMMSGCTVLPHLTGLVECVASGLNDEHAKVRTMTGQALAALAEAAAPYGIESFESVLEPLWTGIRRQRGRGLDAYLKCIGFLIPLMDPEYANYYTREVMAIVLREFETPDKDLRKTVLKVVQQCTSTEGVTPQYLREEVLPPFFKNFWVRRTALDKQSYRLVVETTLVLAQKVGVSDVIERIVDVLKDESEPFRKMAVETVDIVLGSLGAGDISERLEVRLIDGILTAFQEQTVQDVVLLNGFGTTVTALGTRTKPYIPQIVSTILFRLSNQQPAVRQQAADLITKIARVMKQCDDDLLMGKLGNVLYEQLGEEYPDVLGSLLGAMGAIVEVVGLSSMQPPIRDLLPRLTPILRNRHEKVQENTILLVGRIADRGAEYISAREWMRICFELLDLLKAHKKAIRKAANKTFGYIAKAIGPQDVLATLLSNLRVQERQSRVCTAVAIGIVAETCGPFTVLPALMNEYRVPELNVQNGVLKSLTFMFEYIGDMAKDYVYAVTPLVEDALIDRDQVHRQTAATVVKHLALGCIGLGCEDAMIHLLDLLLPNIFETSPHVIDRVLEGIDGIRNAVGAGLVLNNIWAGLFHPARKVRTPYWRLYNTAYVQSSDALVPYYPEVSTSPVEELDIWV